jgi:hypothetical protein
MIDEICETMEGDRPPSKHVWHFSVPMRLASMTVHAWVPAHYKRNALERLRMDDEVWYDKSVKCHGKERDDAVIASGRIKFEATREQ